MNRPSAGLFKRRSQEYRNDWEQYLRQREAYERRRREWRLLVLWDYATGKKLRMFVVPDTDCLSFAFSPDGSRLYAAASGKSFKSQTADEKTTLISWDVKSGRELHKVELGTDVLVSLHVSENAKELVGVTVADDLLRVRHFDVASLAELPSTTKAIEPVSQCCGMDAARHRLLGVVGQSDSIVLWNLASEIEVWRSAIQLPASMEFVSAEPNLILVTSDESVHVVDAATQRLLKKMNGIGDGTRVIFAHMSANTKRVVMFVSDLRNEHAIVVCDRESGSVISRIATGEYITDLDLSPDGERVVAEIDDMAVVWDATNGQVIGRLSPQYGGEAQDVTTVSFLQDGRTVIAGSRGLNWQSKRPAGYVWNPETGVQSPRLIPPDKFFFLSPNRIQQSADGQQLLTVGFVGDLNKKVQRIAGCCIWDTSGEFIRNISVDDALAYSSVLAAADLRLIAFENDARTQVVSADSGATLLRLDGEARSFALSDRLLCLADENGSTRLVDLTTGSDVVRVIRLASGDDWLAVTPEGLFDGTEYARNQVEFRMPGSQERVPVDRFFQDYYRPGLMQEILQGYRPMPTGEFGGQVAPMVKITSPNQGSTVEEPAVELLAEVTDRGGGIKEPWLVQNGARILAKTTDERDGKVLKRTFTVALVEGENRLEVRSASGDGSWESAPAVLVLNYTKPLARPAVHVLAVGVNEYSEEAMNLRFAAPYAQWPSCSAGAARPSTAKAKSTPDNFSTVRPQPRASASRWTRLPSGPTLRTRWSCSWPGTARRSGSVTTSFRTSSAPRPISLKRTFASRTCRSTRSATCWPTCRR